jgi:hypothetical protein
MPAPFRPPERIERAPHAALGLAAHRARDGWVQVPANPATTLLITNALRPIGEMSMPIARNFTWIAPNGDAGIDTCRDEGPTLRPAIGAILDVDPTPHRGELRQIVRGCCPEPRLRVPNAGTPILSVGNRRRPIRP